MSERIQSNKKEDRRTRKTKTQIKLALIELMAQKDVNKISVKELAELADINRGTFYLHYDDVYDVLEQIQNEFIETINRILDECIPHTFLNTPLILFEKIATLIEKDLPYYRKMMNNKYSFELHEKLKGIITDKITTGSKLYENYAKDPRYRFAVVYIVSGTCDYFREWILSDERVPLAELNTIIEKLILVGLNGIQNSLRSDLQPPLEHSSAPETRN